MFLGIEIDTIVGDLHVPTEKLQDIRTLLHDWGNSRYCKRKELEFLIGLLNHACKVVRSGRSFLQRMIDLLHSVHPAEPHPIQLSKGFRSDLAWWRVLVGRWNGVPFLAPPINSRASKWHRTHQAHGAAGPGTGVPIWPPRFNALLAADVPCRSASYITTDLGNIVNRLQSLQALPVFHGQALYSSAQVSSPHFM